MSKGVQKMKNILHDLEEEYDPYYTNIAAVPGSTAETNFHDKDDYLDCAKNLGLNPVKTEVIP
jgi:hypothetical protein